MKNACTSHILKASVLLLCIPSALHAAAFPEQAQPATIKIEANIIEEAIACDVSVQAENYPHLISLLSDLRGAGNNPIQVLVEFDDEDDNHGYHMWLGGFARHNLSPLLFVMSKKYKDAACAIGQAFPDYLQNVDMLRRTPLDYYLDLIAPEPQKEISCSDRNFLNILKPLLSTREGGHKALSYGVGSKEMLIALYLRGARFDAKVFKQKLEKLGCGPHVQSLDNDRYNRLAEGLSLLQVLGEESVVIDCIRKINGFEGAEISAALDAQIAACAPTVLSLIEVERAYLPVCQDIGSSC